jgi:hypothetical protein
MLFADTDNIIATHAVPQVAIPGVHSSVQLSASVVDSANAPVPDVSVTWFDVILNTTLPVTSKTDDSGLATVDIDLATLSEGITVFPYVAYLGSDLSSGKTVTLRIASTTLEFPQVNDGGDFDLDQFNIAGGVTVTIQAYPNAARGDLVNFYWDEVHSTGMSVSDPATDFPWVINANTTLPPACLINGEYSLYYQFRDSNGNSSVSLPRMENVSGGQPTPSLPGADFPEADSNGGYINAALALNGTPAQLTWQGMAVNDVVEMTWIVYDQNGVQQLADMALTATVAAEDITRGYLEITIPPADIPQGLQLGSAQAWYTMTPASGTGAQTSAVTTVGIDTKA